MDELLARLVADVPRNPFLDEQKTKTYVWVQDGDSGRIVPSIVNAFWSPYLYRGQLARHTPCVPAVFRKLKVVKHPQQLSRKERARCFLDRVRLEEFLLALAQHPACEYSREVGLVISTEAIAQHYGMTTDRLDLTQDPAVAAFFATNRRNPSGNWRAVANGIGVVYRIDARRVQQCLPEPSDLECIGKQALPRPGEQKAWTLRVPLGLDFEKLPIDVFTFAHNKHSGNRLNARFEAGKRLFPEDALADVAATIRDAKSVPRELVAKVLMLINCPPAIFEQELEASTAYLSKHFGVAVRDRELISFSTTQRSAAQRAVSLRKRKFLEDVGVWAVRRASRRELRR